MSSPQPTTDTLNRVLNDRFGLEAVRPIQRAVIDRLMAGGDAMLVLPTGGGKSLCYQLPAVAMPPAPGGPGVTLVFSPLIALMEDQVQALRARGIRAAYINSTLKRREREKVQAELADGAFEIIYATPERMLKDEFRAALDALPGGVRLLAVDECHCISKWGHDLRPAYREVGRFREQLGCPPTVALTATATAEVRADVRTVLGLDEQQMPLFAAGIDRPNLGLDAEEVFSDDDKIDRICKAAAQFGGTGIVYFALIKDLDRMADALRPKLKELGRKIEIYHGRLDPRDKKRAYERFARATPDDGLTMFATNAFGMGVDKSDIRFIVHAQVPGSVEAYWQEVGRAGRDGEPSQCLLLYQQEDLAIQQQFVEWKNPPPGLLRELDLVLATKYGDEGHGDFEADDLRLDVLGKGRGGGIVEHAVIELEHLGVIERTGVEDRYRPVRRLRDEDIDEADIAEKTQRDLKRLLGVVQMVRGGNIRERVLDYFGIDSGIDFIIDEDSLPGPR